MGNTQRRLNVVLVVDSGGMNDGIKAGLAKVREFADETKRINSEIEAQQRAVVAAAAAARGAMDTPEAAARTGEAIRAVQRLNELNDKRSVASGLADMEAKALAEEQATRAALEGEMAVKRQETAMQGMTRETKAAGSAITENGRQTEWLTAGVGRLVSVLAMARLATEGMEVAAAAIEGDWDKAAEAFKRIPVLGRASEAGGHLALAIHNAAAGTGPEWRKSVDEANAATEQLGKLEADARREQADAALDDEGRFQARWTAARCKLMDEGQKLMKAGPAAIDAYYAAKAAVDEQFLAEQRTRWAAEFKGQDEDREKHAEEERRAAQREYDADAQQEEQAARDGWEAKMAADAEGERDRQREAEANAAQEERAAKEGWDAKMKGDEEIDGEMKRADEKKLQDRAKLAEWSTGRLDAASPMRQYKAFEAKIKAAVNAGDMTYAQGNAQLAGESKRLTGGPEPQGGQFMDAEGYSRAIQSALMAKPDVSEQILAEEGSSRAIQSALTAKPDVSQQILAELEKLNRLGVKLAA